jgi:hypothetical protein
VSQCAGIWLGGADHEKRIMCLLLPQEPIVRACPLWVISGHFSVPASCGHSVACASCPLRANSGHSAIHSITSSALVSSAGGMGRPSAFAVLRLKTSSNLVGCTTGRLAGFSPLRMRPAPDLSVRVGEACSVAGQAGRSDKQTPRIDCWDRVAGRQRDQLITDGDKEDIGANKKRFSARLDKTGKDRVQITHIAGLQATPTATKPFPFITRI